MSKLTLEDVWILCLSPEVDLPGVDVPLQAHRGAVSVEIGEAVLCAYACFESLHGIEETSGPAEIQLAGSTSIG